MKKQWMISPLVPSRNEANPISFSDFLAAGKIHSKAAAKPQLPKPQMSSVGRKRIVLAAAPEPEEEEEEDEDNMGYDLFGDFGGGGGGVGGSGSDDDEDDDERGGPSIVHRKVFGDITVEKRKDKGKGQLESRVTNLFEVFIT